MANEKMDSLDLRHYHAALWEEQPKRLLKDVTFGSVVLVMEEVEVDDADLDDDEIGVTPVPTVRIFRVLIPYSSNLAMYKYRGEGFLCRMVGYDRSTITPLKKGDKDCECVVLFDAK
jgi:hypothetical protein